MMRFREYQPFDANMNERYLIEHTDDGWEVVSESTGPGNWAYVFEVRREAEVHIERYRQTKAEQEKKP